MNRIWLAAALAALPLPAAAADIQPQVAQPTPPGAVWSGPYVGLNLGYLSSNVGLLAARPHGISGGIQAGYNWQSGPVVFGGEADIQASGAEDTFAAFKFSNPWFGTVRGRVGYAFANILLYATAGLAYGSGKLEISGLRDTQTHLGWAGGGGVEVGLTLHWSVKAEYLFVGLADSTYVLSGTSASGIESHLVRFGVNYRF